MLRIVCGFLLLGLAGCGGLNTTFNKPYAPETEAAPSPPPPEVAPPAVAVDQASVAQVLGMEQDRLWVSLASRPAGMSPQVLLTPRGMRLPSVNADCPLERNLARALVVFLNERLAGQVLQLEGMVASGEGVAADATLDGQPLLRRLESEGLARPAGSPGWCP